VSRSSSVGSGDKRHEWKRLGRSRVGVTEDRAEQVVASLVSSVDAPGAYLLATLGGEHSPSVRTSREDIRLVSVRALQVVGQRLDPFALKHPAKPLAG
jgi:hypothetical protein